MENQDFTFSPSLPLSVCFPRENPDRLEEFFPAPCGQFQDRRQPAAGDTGNIAIGNLSSAPFQWAFNYWLSAPFTPCRCWTRNWR